MNRFLEIRNITKAFGSAQALQDLSLDLAEDELLVILGPTGAGKTTLLRVLTGLESPDAGQIRNQARDLLVQTPSQRDLALVFQNFSLYPDWTVRKNLEFPLRAPGRNLAEAEIRSRVEEAAELLKITGLLDKPSQRLSGGEMQRVALGRALVRRPRAFLLDEPLTNLDAKLREQLRLELVELRRRLKIPMIFVTHDQEEAFAMADRVAVLDQGRLLQTGTPEEIYEKPASPQVALQLGQPAVNLIGPEDAARAGWDWVGSRTLGLRPEHLNLTGGSDQARLLALEDLGPQKVALISWKGLELRALLGPESGFRAGQSVQPRFDRGKALLW